MSNDNLSIIVLVSGASGYLGAHCVKRLLSNGYYVRGTVRSLSNREKILPLETIAKEFPNAKLELVEADLLQSEDWKSVIQGCTYVLHVASPFPIQANETTVTTAVDGTLNVLQACAAKSSIVKKVVLTSSCSAVNEGYDDPNKIFTEEDWSLTDKKKVMAYPRSKTEAEKAAWKFVKNLNSDNNRFALTCLNPTLIIGPILIDTQGTSISIMRRFLSGKMPAVPALQFALVDVRDVAEAHVRAMQTPKTDFQRILITAQPSFWFREIAKVLGDEFRNQGYYVPQIEIPNIIVWLYSFFDYDARESLSRLGKTCAFDNTKAKSLLKIEFIKPEKSMIEMIYSMIDRGILPDKLQKCNSHRQMP